MTKHPGSIPRLTADVAMRGLWLAKVPTPMLSTHVCRGGTAAARVRRRMAWLYEKSGTWRRIVAVTKVIRLLASALVHAARPARPGARRRNGGRSALCAAPVLYVTQLYFCAQD